MQFQLTAQEGSARFGAIRLTATSLPQPLSECVIGRLSQLRLDPVAIGTFTDTPVELRWTADELRQKAAAWSESAAGE